MSLADSRVACRLPVQDLQRARAFYAECLGLEPVDERPGGLLYRPAGGGEFALFTSTGAPSGDHTQMAFEVADLDATLTELRARGVAFEEVAEIEGNYPSKGATGERGTWFRDSEGNLLGIGQPVSSGAAPPRS